MTSNQANVDVFTDEIGNQFINELREQNKVMRAKFTTQINYLTSLLKQTIERNIQYQSSSFSSLSERSMSRSFFTQARTNGDVRKSSEMSLYGESFQNGQATPPPLLISPSVSLSISVQSFNERASTLDDDPRVDLPSRYHHEYSCSSSKFQTSECREKLPISKYSRDQSITRRELIDDILSWLGIDKARSDVISRTSNELESIYSSNDSGRSTFSENEFDWCSDSLNFSSNATSCCNDEQSMDDFDEEAYFDDVYDF